MTLKRTFEPGSNVQDSKRLYIYREQNITIAVSFSSIAFSTPCVYHTAGLVCSITTETAGSGKTHIVLSIFFKYPVTKVNIFIFDVINLLLNQLKKTLQTCVE